MTLTPAGLAQAPASIALRWSQVADAAAYELQIAEDPQFQTLSVQTRLTLPGYRWAHLPRQRYYWRVRSVDAQGRLGDWSGIRTIEPAVAAPTVLRPGPNETVAADRPLVVEVAPSEVIRQYVVELSSGADGAPAGHRQLFEGARTAIPPDALGVGRRLLRVRGVDLGGRDTEWSAPIPVTVLHPAPRRALRQELPPPELLTPEDGERLQARDGEAAVTLRWREIPHVHDYTVELSSTPRFAPAQTRTHRVAAPAWTGGLGEGTWFARITASAAGASSSTAPRRFIIVSRPPLPAPTPLGPGAGERVPRGALTLRWTPLEAAHRYELELEEPDRPAVSLTSDGASLQLTRDTDGPRRWRVRAVAPARTPGPWSDWRTFEIGVPAAARAELSFTAGTLRADGVATTSLQLRLLDGAGRFIRGAQPELVASAGTVTPLREENGVYTASFVAPREAPPEEAVTLRIRDRGFETTRLMPVRAPEPRWLLGAELGWNLTLGALSSPFAGLAVDVPLPAVDRRLWVLGRLGGYFGRRQLALPGLRVDADAQVGRGAILGALRFPWRGLEIGGGVGPTLQLVRARVGTQVTVAPAAGVQLLLSGHYRLGPGMAALELSYSFGEVETPEVRLRSGGATAALGYRVAFR